MKTKQYIFYILIFVMLITQVHLHSEEQIIDGVLCIIGENIITLSEFNDVYKPVLQQIYASVPEGQRAEKIKKSKEDILESLVTNKLLIQIAKKEKINISESKVEKITRQEYNKIKDKFNSEEEFQQQLKMDGLTESEFFSKYRKRTREQLLIQKVIGRMVHVDMNVTEKDISDFVKKHKKELGLTDEIKIYHILLKVPSQADQEKVESTKAFAEKLYQRIISGEDFVELAKKYSEGPNPDEGGDLGYFKRGTFLPEIEDIAFNLVPGEVSQVFQTKFGFHIVKMIDRKKSTGVVSDEDMDRVKQFILSQRRQIEVEKLIKDLKKEIYIKINKKMIDL